MRVQNRYTENVKVFTQCNSSCLVLSVLVDMYTQVSVLSRACSDFLISTLDLSNCLSLSALAEGYGSSSLQQKANEFVVQNFHSFSLTQDFLEMEVQFLFSSIKKADVVLWGNNSSRGWLGLWTPSQKELGSISKWPYPILLLNELNLTSV